MQVIKMNENQRLVNGKVHTCIHVSVGRHVHTCECRWVSFAFTLGLFLTPENQRLVNGKVHTCIHGGTHVYTCMQSYTYM